jgi:oxygen-independent coproporphyrinogen-3 oxidase
MEPIENWPVREDTSGLYLHIPFCRKACHYCDFHFSTQLDRIDQMVVAIQRELEIRSRNWPFPKLHSVYLGGGTPSLLSGHQLEAIFATIHHHFNISSEAEITLEANPDDMNLAFLKSWKAIGINRLSIGLQTFQDERLKWMNRIHNTLQGREAVQLAREAGFKNISLDLMYQFPDSTVEDVEADLSAMLSLEPEHISAYGLTLEPKTVFGNWQAKGKLSALDEESAVEQFHLVRNRLEASGYLGYEISNFGKPGHLAVHNRAYWFQRPYLGIGPGAHGFDGDKRYENKPNNAGYLKHLLEENMLFATEEILSPESRLNERILTRLRTIWGLSLTQTRSETGLDLENLRFKEIQMFLEQGHLIKENNVLYLTYSGKILADHLAMELMV